MFELNFFLWNLSFRNLWQEQGTDAIASQVENLNICILLFKTREFSTLTAFGRILYFSEKY